MSASDMVPSRTVETWTANGHTFAECDFDPTTPVGYVAWKLSLTASVRLPGKADALDFYRRMAAQLVDRVRAGQAADPPGGPTP